MTQYKELFHIGLHVLQTFSKIIKIHYKYYHIWIH